MDVDSLWQLVTLVLLLFGSAFFSGSEVALFSLDRDKLKNQVPEESALFFYLRSLLDDQRRLLVTVLIGNNAVNVAASIIAVAIALSLGGSYGLSEDLALTLQIIILTVVILVFGEIIPKVFASRNPVLFSKIIAVPMYYVSMAVYPAAQFVSDIIRLVFKNVKLGGGRSLLTGDELPDLAELGRQKGSLEHNEQELIQSIYEYKTVTVREVMRPRVDIAAVSVDTPVEELIQLIREKGHSRIPLYKNDIDEIIGIIHAKDLLPVLRSETGARSFSLVKIARKPVFVPETKLISDLMREFQEKKTHIAIVVDEYGGTSGLVTFEDIIEEIIGEIRDEYDKEEEQIQSVGERKWVVDGTTPVDEINNLLGVQLMGEEENVDTIGGFVFIMAGAIPDEKFNFIDHDHRFTVTEVENNRIQKVTIEKVT